MRNRILYPFLYCDKDSKFWQDPSVTLGTNTISRIWADEKKLLPLKIYWKIKLKGTATLFSLIIFSVFHSQLTFSICNKKIKLNLLQCCTNTNIINDEILTRQNPLSLVADIYALTIPHSNVCLLTIYSQITFKIEK